MLCIRHKEDSNVAAVHTVAVAKIEWAYRPWPGLESLPPQIPSLFWKCVELARLTHYISDIFNFKPILAIDSSTPPPVL